MIRVDMIRQEVLSLRALPEIIEVGDRLLLIVYKSVGFSIKYGKNIKVIAEGKVIGKPYLFREDVGKDRGFSYIVQYCRIRMSIEMIISFTSVPKVVNLDNYDIDFIWSNGEWRACLSIYDQAFSIGIQDRKQIIKSIR